MEEQAPSGLEQGVLIDSMAPSEEQPPMTDETIQSTNALSTQHHVQQEGGDLVLLPGEVEPQIDAKRRRGKLQRLSDVIIEQDAGK
jgi:hypothetical protein